MTLMCIERSQSPTHKGSILQGRKSSSSSNINQSNANHSRKRSCSPPMLKSSSNNHPEPSSKHLNSNAKLERSNSEPTADRKQVQSTNSSRYKTELCRPFEENGTCKYGDKCQFAHGEKELRSMARHPKYKTELCRTFHSTGLCPYGPRCHFIHNSEQNKKSVMTNLACNLPAMAPVSRPQALNSLGSDGDLSPTSSNEGSPTGTKSFDDIYNQSPLSPQNNVFFPRDSTYHLFENARDCPEIIDTLNMFSDKLENENFNPLLDFYSTAPPPVTPTTPMDTYNNFFRFSLFDNFAK